jgi:hypothetical protein
MVGHIMDKLMNRTFSIIYIASLLFVFCFTGQAKASYLPSSGSSSVGIGTALTTTSALTIMSGNVGIGTWKPAYPLEIKTGDAFSMSATGAIVAAGNVSSTGGNMYALTFYDIDNTAYFVNPAGPSSAVFAGAVGLGTTLTTTSALTVMNGNVGIGTWKPDFALDVVGDIKASGKFRGDGSLLTGIASGGGWTLGTNNVGISTTNAVGIGTALTDNAGLTIMNGAVGIGTWKPGSSTLLDVRGSGVFTGTLTVSSSLVANSSASIGATLSVSSTSTFTGNSVFRNSVGIGTSLAANRLDVQGGVGIGTSYAGYMAAPANGLIVEGNVGLGTTVPVAGLAVMNGNVGIGTWKPVAMLDVGIGKITGGTLSGTYRNYLNMASTAAGSFPAVDTEFPSGGIFRSGEISIAGTNDVFFQALPVSSSGYGYLEAYNAAGMILGTGGTASPIIFKPNRTEYMRITGTGNVGIGTTIPGGALTVMNGNVGIGTWKPEAMLDLGPSGGIRLGGVTNTSWPSGSSQWITTSGVGIGTYDSVGIGTTTPQGAGLVITNGNLGIGTWAPTSAFTVGSGSTKTELTSTAALVLGASGSLNIRQTNGGTEVKATAFDSNLVVQYGDVGGLSSNTQVGIYQNGGEAIRIDKSKNVGIGTTLPGGALTVMNGNVGIGTWIPNQLLDIGTNHQFTVASSGNIAANGGAFNSAVSASSIQTDTIWTTSAANMKLYTGSGFDERVRILSASPGNVGIGTTIPGGGLVVMNGNVGIGTWIPAEALHVIGNIKASGSITGTATKRINVLSWAAIPDTSGDCFFEPYTILASNDVWGRMIARFGASNSAQPTVRAGIYGGFVVPKDYAANGKFIVVWTSTITSGDVVWDLDYRTVAGDDSASLDQAGNEESLSGTDTAPGAANRRLEKSITATAANFAADDEVEFALFRDGTDGNDTLAGSAILFELLFEYTTQ